MFAEAAMEVSDAPRPVASAGYNFIRWTGGAVAPYAAAKLGEQLNAEMSYVGAGCCVIAIGILVARRGHLSALDIDHTIQDARTGLIAWPRERSA